MTLMILCCLWVLSSAAVALLPMRRQYVPGVAFLIAALVLIVAIGFQHNWGIAALGLAAFLSMFRNPLKYFYARLRGNHLEAPK
jgi:hypothetical protein